MNWCDYFDYVDGKLINKHSRSYNSLKGEVVGSSNGAGYLRFSFNGSKYYVHRVIWEIIHGEIPKGMEIDHINHIKDDNRIENLRLVIHRDNLRNQSKQRNNTSGFCGVSWDKSRDSWFAYAVIDDKFKNLGVFVNYNDAVSARSEFNEFFGFHNNHGKKL